jgi:hypothetical protein
VDAGGLDGSSTPIAAMIAPWLLRAESGSAYGPTKESGDFSGFVKPAMSSWM